MKRLFAYYFIAGCFLLMLGNSLQLQSVGQIGIVPYKHIPDYIQGLKNITSWSGVETHKTLMS